MIGNFDIADIAFKKPDEIADMTIEMLNRQSRRVLHRRM